VSHNKTADAVAIARTFIPCPWATMPIYDGPQCEPLHSMQQMYITAEKWKDDFAEKWKD
jgi:hypothetical protein